ncbi:glutamyl-tRNA reductase [Bradymonas sediminis]|uniref:Glutamyl-tRNA reductase n=1 Tax=Bradymonas sediminis TaxID=1548548 RepID=A0A2Z4FKY7_9DELT|nr:glutamyl-tRNA reductase [Bradymonas sediminis]AWV89562.1 glutamyl-tRNA reductase [Bradymonas sediminis]TDP76704.1 glutamyl-tRNA reductase [Bradymonas sediminis]
MSTANKLIAFSFSHKNTSLKERDRLAFSAEDVAAFMAEVRLQLGSEAAVISTCNRSELYFFGPAAALTWAKVWDAICAVKFGAHDRPAPPSQPPHTFEEHEAALHLFRVAASLESIALGENQILSQLKAAHALMLEQPVKCPTLDRLFQFALRCGKEVRTETGLCAGTVSISSVAVRLAEKIFGSFAQRQILIIGAGETAEKAAGHFQGAGAEDFVVVNRSEAKGRALAEKFGGTWRGLNAIAQSCVTADVVLVATGATDFLLTTAIFKDVMKKRHHRSIFLIDISNPRNIDPALAKQSGVFLYNMDDLQSVVADNLDARRQEIPAAEQLVARFVEEWELWAQTLQVTPTIATLARYFDAIREQELERHGGQMSETERVMLEDFSRGLVKKLLHHPIMYLRSSVQEKTFKTEDLRVLRSLYKLQDFEEQPDEN